MIPRNRNNCSSFWARSGVLPHVLLILVSVMIAACTGPTSEPAAPAEATVAPTDMAAQSATEATPAVEEIATSGRGAGDTLRLLYWQAPTIVNPHLSPGTKDLNASRIPYEPLASFDKEGTLVPFLAAEIPTLENGGVAADGKSVTWKLKEGIKWADGEPFTADDVLFTYEYVTNPDVAATSVGTYAGIESVEVIDDFTVKINFEDVNPAWTLPFIGNQGMIIPRHIFEAYNGPNFQEAPANLQAIGTGPYYVTEFRTEDILIIGEDAVNTIKIVYEPNPYYREPDKPFFSRVELEGGGDAEVAARAGIVEGVVDFSWGLAASPETLEQLLAEGSGEVEIPPSAFVEYILFNFTDPNRETADGERSSLELPHPFLTDKTVRQAIAHAIDRAAVAKAYDITGPQSDVLLSSPPTFRSDTPYPYPYDLDKAAALLDEAGWIDSDGDGIRDKDDVKLSLVFQTSVQPLRQATQEIVKQGLEAIGIEVELKQIDSSIYFGPVEENTNTRRHFYADLEMFAFSNKSPDPGAYLKGWTCSEIAQKANNWALTNWGRYCNAEYEALFDQAATELDPETRQELFKQMNDILIEDVALIPLVERPLPTATNNGLTGLDITPWDVDVWNIADWQRE